MESIHKLVYTLPGNPDAPPSEFPLFLFGTTDTTKGEYSFDQESADAVMAQFADYGNRLTMDYEHMALADPPVPAPAAASFIPAMRGDGLYATDVKWTKKASDHLTAKEYLFYSPAFLKDPKGRPSRLVNVALTNIPATKRMQPLVAANQKFKEPAKMDTVLKALSLKDDCGEAEVLSAVTALHDERRKLCALTGKDGVGESLALISAWKIAAGEVEQLRADVTKREAEQASKDFDAEIAAAKQSALLSLSDNHKANVAALALKSEPNALKLLKIFLGGLSPIVALASATPAHVEPAATEDVMVVLSDEEKKMARQMGVSLDALAKNKARHVKQVRDGHVVGQDDKDAA